jgi:hypothetical protein
MITFEHNGKQHTVELCDDDGPLTVFAVDGIKTRIHIDFVPGGRLTDDTLVWLAKMEIDPGYGVLTADDFEKLLQKGCLDG